MISRSEIVNTVDYVTHTITQGSEPDQYDMLEIIKQSIYEILKKAGIAQ